MAQIDNFSILNPKTFDANGVITASSSATGTPTSNLQDDQPRNIWKSTSITSQYLVVDLGSVSTIQQIFLGYHNLTSSGTIRVRSADTEAGLTSAPDSDNTYEAYTQLQGAVADLGDHFDRGFNHFFINLSSALTNQWVRLDFTDAGNPDGYFKAGRLIIGDPFQPAGGDGVNPIQQGSVRFGVRDRSPRQQTLDGSLYVTPKTKINYCSFRVQKLSESEMLDGYDEISRDMAGSGAVLVALEPNVVQRRHKKLFYGLLDAVPMTLTLKTSEKTRYALDLSVVEMI